MFRRDFFERIDGINLTSPTSAVAGSKFSIFNRRGQKVFTTTLRFGSGARADEGPGDATECFGACRVWSRIGV